MKHPKVLTIIMAGALAVSLGLVGCGANPNATPDASTSETTAAEKAETKGETTESSASEDATKDDAGKGSAADDTKTESKENASAKIDVDSWKNAWMGVSDKDEYFYYAESPDGKLGAMVILNEKDEYWRYVGETSTPKENWVTLTDAETGAEVTFEVTVADKDGNVIIDLGDDGKAVLAKCEIDDVWNAIGLANEYLEKVN